jgi:hypothetical protein
MSAGGEPIHEGCVMEIDFGSSLRAAPVGEFSPKGEGFL